MKILFLTHTFPFPLNEGVRLHVYHLLRELAKRHQIFLLSLNDQPVSENSLKEIKSLGVIVAGTFHHSVPQSALRRLLNCLFGKIPFCVEQFQSRPLRQALQKFFQENTVDVVHVEYISMALYCDIFKKVPKIFCPLDAVSMLFERNTRSEINFLRRLYTKIQWHKVRDFEKNWIPKFNATMLVSPVDREHILKHCPNARVAVSAIGVDSDYFAPQNISEEPDTIVFRGMLNFLPNADAVRFFYKEIFPKVAQKIPQIKFLVVGQNPPADILSWTKQDSRLVCTGYVDDIRQPMAAATIIIVPMRIGSGMKIKILESMAMAKPVIATPMSCAGLNATAGQHLFLEESAENFAARVVELLQNPQLRKKIGEAGRQLIVENYAWSKSAEDFEKLYRDAIEDPPKKDDRPAGKAER